MLDPCEQEPKSEPKGPLTEVRWLELLRGIAANSTFNGTLDLSGYTRSDSAIGGGLRSNGTFDPVSSSSTGKKKIVLLILPDTATGIAGGTSAIPLFRFFTNLESFSGAMLSTIGAYAFTDNKKLNMPELPASITSIDNNAFQGCTGLTQITLPVNITSIGNSAFYGCINLVRVTSHKTTPPFPAATAIGHLAFMGCTNLTNVNIPAAAAIGDGAFLDNISLTNVSFPAATLIGGGAFQGCTSLTSVSFPAATEIGGTAFRGCSSLTSVSFPAADSIGAGAFSETAATSLIVTLGPVDPLIGVTMFQNINTVKNVTVRVPAGATGYTGFPSENIWSSTWENHFRGFGSSNNGIPNLNINLILETY
ncbi:MAG: leucine-rich repeat domain-containing protein [Treponema sp.]|nr:leucine-rich repeat domain-containing protein [Treponema sp.]